MFQWLWPRGKKGKAGTISTYDACSLAATDLDFRRTYQGNIVQYGLSMTYIVIMRMVPLLFLVVCGITMLVLLRKKEQKQKALNATRNIYKLSRISTILLINFILLEIPHFMSSVFFVYYFVYLPNSVSNYENATLYDLKAVYVQALKWITTIRLISKVSSGANSGIVLVVYSLLSRKFREDFMSFLGAIRIEFIKNNIITGRYGHHSQWFYFRRLRVCNHSFV